MKFHKFLILLVFASFLILLSCEKFKGEQVVPAYIKIDTIFLLSNPLIEEGELTHNFTDVWVYVDDQIIGAFELPALVPVLVSGPHQLELYPGIKLNGISSSRSSYPFVKPKVYEEFNFVIDSIITVNPGVTYYDNVDFIWMEDFEDASHNLEPTSNSDTTLNIYTYNTVIPFYGGHSGVGYLDNNNTIFEVVTYDEEIPGYVINSGNLPLILEMDYKTNNFLVVGLFIRDFGSNLTQHPVVVLNSTEGKWKKVYVNFSPSITAYYNADYFNVYFRSDKESKVEAPVVKIDNLKLIQRGSF